MQLQEERRVGLELAYTRTISFGGNAFRGHPYRLDLSTGVRYAHQGALQL